jgi:hypothetical protein
MIKSTTQGCRLREAIILNDVGGVLQVINGREDVARKSVDVARAHVSARKKGVHVSGRSVVSCGVGVALMLV